MSPEPGWDGPEIVDPDVDLHDPVARRELAGPGRARVLAAIAVGGVVGAETRYAVSLALPHPAGAWPWSTLLINLSGCLLIGVLMVVVTERFRVHPLTRPLLGVGVLGGYTTFSTYAVDVITGVHAGQLLAAAAYVVATPVLALLAVTVGVLGTRRVVGTRVAGEQT